MPDLATLVNSCIDSEQPASIIALPHGHWVFMPEVQDTVVHLEATTDPQKVLIHASLARDGTGLVMSSFMSALFACDSHATTADGIGVWSNSQAVHYFIHRSLGHLDANGLLQLLHNFSGNLVNASFALQQIDQANYEDDIFGHEQYSA